MQRKLSQTKTIVSKPYVFKLELIDYELLFGAILWVDYKIKIYKGAKSKIFKKRYRINGNKSWNKIAQDIKELIR